MFITILIHKYFKKQFFFLIFYKFSPKPLQTKQPAKISFRFAERIHTRPTNVSIKLNRDLFLFGNMLEFFWVNFVLNSTWMEKYFFLLSHLPHILSYRVHAVLRENFKYIFWSLDISFFFCVYYNHFFLNYNFLDMSSASYRH